jgi:hyperosmotically inducible periplasmic protein
LQCCFSREGKTADGRSENTNAVESLAEEPGGRKADRDEADSSSSLGQVKRRSKMNGSSKLQKLLVPIGSLVFCASLAAGTPVAPAVPAQQAPPDNTKTNKDQGPPTADQQKMNPADRAITQKIRKAIHQDTSLSTYAHNIKVITQDGKVTLRGPVRSDDEKSNIEAKAVAVAGEGNVTNQLEIAPPKQ